MRFLLVLSVVACKGGGDSEDDGKPDGGPTDETGTTPTEWDCALADGPSGCDAPDFAPQIGCKADFDQLGSLPLDTSIPGARSVKTVLDQSDGENTLYFQNSVKYPIHWDFAFNNLSAPQGHAPVPELAAFNGTEYYSPDRRFILGAIIYYEAPDIWTYEIAPYDTASAEMVAKAFNEIRENAYFGDVLKFHPSSVQHDTNVVPELPPDIPIITTDELFDGVEFQTYNPGRSTGLLRFYSAADLEGTYIPFRELVVLDAVPNDISVVAGIITSEFQTPLAHINVLSINRGTPNMGLADAQENAELKALEGKWVELDVKAESWTIKEITVEEADAWWEEYKPDPLESPSLDLTVTDLRDVEDIVADGADLTTEILTGISRFGSKGTNYAGLYDIGQNKVPIQNAFVIPFYWYDHHMATNGLRAELEALLVSDEWSDPQFRATRLEQFKEEIVAAPLDPAFLASIHAKTEAMWPGSKTRFRSSTNAEDLGNFTGAGLYDSQTGDPEIPDGQDESIEWAIKAAWSNIWNARAYEERAYYGIDQLGVAMALLTTPNFPDEEANGVAVTNNIFDATGLEPAFFVNVQIEDFEVVQPEAGTLSDSYIHYYYSAGQPLVYISHSNLVPEGETVLTNQQSNELGVALDEIHRWFLPVYGNDGDWYGMDIEFKFDDKNTPGTPQLFIKQARPLPWTPGATTSACE